MSETEKNEEIMSRMRGDVESEDSFENDPSRDVEYQLMVMTDRARTLKNELDL